MSARERQAGPTDGDAEHDFLLSYLNSAAWEARLAEARAKRQALLDGRAPGAGKDVERPPDAVPAARPPVRTPIRAPVREADATGRARWPYAAAGFCAAGLLVGATLVLRDPGTIDMPLPAPDGAATVPADLVTRNRTDTPSPLAPVPRSGPAARTAPAGLGALASSLKEMGASNAITVVASARQAKALAGLDSATSAASIRITPFELDRAMVSFYHPGDAAAARRLADRLDGEMMDLSGMHPSPPDGALSVHLARY